MQITPLSAVPHLPPGGGRLRLGAVDEPLDVPLLERDALRPADALLQPRGRRAALPGVGAVLRPGQVRGGGGEEEEEEVTRHFPYVFAKKKKGNKLF